MELFFHKLELLPFSSHAQVLDSLQLLCTPRVTRISSSFLTSSDGSPIALYEILFNLRNVLCGLLNGGSLPNDGNSASKKLSASESYRTMIFR
jgi:hypothetical protein